MVSDLKLLQVSVCVYELIVSLQYEKNVKILHFERSVGCRLQRYQQSHRPQHHVGHVNITASSSSDQLSSIALTIMSAPDMKVGFCQV